MSPPAKGSPRLPGTVAEVEASPQGEQIAAFFDLDGTIVAGFTVTEYTKARLSSRDMGLMEMLTGIGAGLAFQTGQSTFEELVRRVSAGLRGRRHTDLMAAGQRIFADRIADLLYPETRALIRAHQARGHRVVLCSSATDIQVEPAADYLGVDTVLCNRFEQDQEGVLTGRLVEPVIWGPGKAQAAERYAAAHQVSLGDCYFYADGDEDEALMHLVGNPRPTNPGPRLTKVATRRGWPITRYSSRGGGKAKKLARMAAGISALGPVTTGAALVGLATGNKRKAVDVLTGYWPRIYLSVNGVEINVVGEHNARDTRPAVFIFNHRNNADALIAAAVVRDGYTGVAKAELRAHPIIGSFGRVMDIAFLERGDTKQSVQALQDVARLIDKGVSILIAPEGTRHDTVEVGRFKKGAFVMAAEAGVPIIPIVIRNAHEIAGRDAATVNPGVVDVAVLRPIDTTGWTDATIGDHMEEIRQLFLDTLADWPDEGDPRV